MPITVIAKLKVQAGKDAEFEAAAKQMIATVKESEPGTLSYVLHKNTKDADRVRLLRGLPGSSRARLARQDRSHESFRRKDRRPARRPPRNRDPPGSRPQVKKQYNSGSPSHYGKGLGVRLLGLGDELFSLIAANFLCYVYRMNQPHHPPRRSKLGDARFRRKTVSDGTNLPVAEAPSRNHNRWYKSLFSTFRFPFPLGKGLGVGFSITKVTV